MRFVVNDWGLNVIVLEETQSPSGKYVANPAQAQLGSGAAREKVLRPPGLGRNPSQTRASQQRSVPVIGEGLHRAQ